MDAIYSTVNLPDVVWFQKKAKIVMKNEVLITDMMNRDTSNLRVKCRTTPLVRFQLGEKYRYAILSIYFKWIYLSFVLSLVISEPVLISLYPQETELNFPEIIRLGIA